MYILPNYIVQQPKVANHIIIKNKILEFKKGVGIDHYDKKETRGSIMKGHI